MTIDEFRKNGELVAEWRDVLALPITKIVLAVMEDYAPVHRLVKGDITPTFAHVRLGHQTGWAEYGKTMSEAILIPPKTTDPDEQTFEDPNIENEI